MPKENDIIERIEKEFDEKYPANALMMTIFEKNGVEVKDYYHANKEIKSFLHTSLLKVREETVKEVIEKTEGMKEEIKEISYSPGHDEEFWKILVHEQTLKIGRNQALSDLESLLNKTLK